MRRRSICLVEGEALGGAQAGAQGVPEAEGDVGVLGAVFGGAVERDLGEGDAAAAGAR